jgi:hypothetical protein
MEAVMSVLMYVVPLLLASGFAWLKTKSSRHSKAIEALEAGVLNAWETFGSERKGELVKEFEDPNHPRETAKFEKEDREKLRSIAKETAGKVLAGEGLSLDTIIKSPELQDLAIRKIVDKIKK